MNRELTALGERGMVIAEAREQVLEILLGGNSCSAWFEEVDPSVATVFRSLHYELGRGASEIFQKPDADGKALYKHPWGASATESGGLDSTITINSNGPFFVHESRLSRISEIGGPARPLGWHLVFIGPYPGDTPEARTTILLHELGHIVGRLPADDGSWNGESSRNTVTVLQHCRAEIHEAKLRVNDNKTRARAGSIATSRDSRKVANQ